MSSGFTVRPVRTDEEVERYIALNEAVTREGAIARRLLASRPGANREDFLAAFEDAMGRMVSTTCLLRWDLSCDGVPLRAAMLELVVTDPAYRKHGLVRRQVEAFHARAAAVGADLCIIQGIPYYYRQFGYSYALDHTPTVRLAAGPAAGPVRPALLRAPRHYERALIARAFDTEMGRQRVSVTRSSADWEYLLGPAGRSVLVAEVDGRFAGYASADDGQESVWVGESGLEDARDAGPLLAALSKIGARELVVVGSRASSLARAAEDRGGTRAIPSQWLVRLVDPAAFLRRLAPALERRLAAAGEPGRDLVINLFRGALRLRMDRGAIAGVDELGFVDASMGADGGDLCIPPEALPRLLLGYRTLDELRDAWPDIVVKPGAKPLLEALFPRRDSLVLMPY